MGVVVPTVTTVEFAQGQTTNNPLTTFHDAVAEGFLPETLVFPLQNPGAGWALGPGRRRRGRSRLRGSHPSPLSFGPSVSSQTVEIALLPRADTEGPRAFRVTLHDPNSQAALGSPSTVTVWILDPPG